MTSKLKYCSSIFLVVLFSLSTRAQVEKTIVGEQDVEMTKELTAGLNLHTNGGLIGGFSFKYQIRYNDRFYHYFNLEIANIKHRKEERFATFSGSSVILGKTNYLFSIRPQYGQQFLLFNKYPEDGVRLNAVVAGGPTIGLVKPYYVKVERDSSFQVVPYTATLDDPIVGNGGFFNGFDQITTKIGFNLKLGLDLEFSNYESTLTGIESGWIFEVFGEDIPLFISNQQTQFFNALYITIYFGSKY